MSYKILVIGESCLDQFQYGKVSRVCPEAPCVVFNPTYKTENLGMAANVVKNLFAIDKTLEIEFLTNKVLPVKIRYVEEDSNQMIMRQDINDHVNEVFNLEPEMWERDWDCLIVSDYNKGFISEHLLGIIPYKFNLSFIDTKRELNDWVMGYDYVKMNEDEYRKSEWYVTNSGKYIVTKGKDGAMWGGENFPSEKIEKLMDVSGAGDSFLAGLVYEYLKSKDMSKAITYANTIAGKVIQKRGVSTL